MNTRQTRITALVLAKTGIAMSGAAQAVKVTQLIVLTLFLLIGSGKVVAASSSFTLQYGPSFSETTSPITYMAQPAYDFGVDQFWNSNGMTGVTITMTEHVEQPVSTTPDGICACFTSYMPPPVYSLSFYIQAPVVAQYSGSQFISDYSVDEPIDFMAGLPGGLLIDGFFSLHIGEIETQLDNNGYEILTSFAADFKLQAGERSFVEVVDPETGVISYTPEFTEYPGNWYAGSLRYQSDTEAFAFLSPVPEPDAYMQMLAGLGMVSLLARRHRTVSRRRSAFAKPSL